MQTLSIDTQYTLPVVTDTPALSPDAGRAIRDAAEATAAGFSLPRPIYAVGTAVNQTGVRNFRQSRRDFEKLPFVTDACGELIEKIQKEHRENIVVDAPNLELDDRGRLSSLPISERALEGLARLVTPGGAGYLVNCPPRLRALNINHWLREAWRTDDNGVRYPREIVLRTRDTAAGGREAFSIVGPRYRPLDIDAIAETVIEVLPPDARAELVYDGYRARISVLFHSNIEPEHCVAGEIFKAGLNITTADDGTSAIRIAAQVWRNLCRNLIIIGRADQATTTPHLGRQLPALVRDAIHRGLAKVSSFAARWSEATVENVLERYDVDDVATLFERLVANRAVRVPGVSADEMVERLQRAWDFEPGYSKAAIVNAITRAAHTEEWRSWTTTEDLEQTAGQLLYAKVWNVQLPDEA